VEAGETQKAAESKGERGQKGIAGGEIGEKPCRGGMEAEGEERAAGDSSCRPSGGMLCAAGRRPGLGQPTGCTNAGTKEVTSAGASGSDDVHLKWGKSLFAFFLQDMLSDFCSLSGVALLHLALHLLNKFVLQLKC